METSMSHPTITVWLQYQAKLHLQPRTTNQDFSQFSRSTSGHFIYLHAVHCTSSSPLTTSFSWLTHSCNSSEPPHSSTFLYRKNEFSMIWRGHQHAKWSEGLQFLFHPLTVHPAPIATKSCNVPERCNKGTYVLYMYNHVKHVPDDHQVQLLLYLLGEAGGFLRCHVPACTCCRQIPFNHLDFPSPVKSAFSDNPAVL